MRLSGRYGFPRAHGYAASMQMHKAVAEQIRDLVLQKTIAVSLYVANITRDESYWMSLSKGPWSYNREDQLFMAQHSLHTYSAIYSEKQPPKEF